MHNVCYFYLYARKSQKRHHRPYTLILAISSNDSRVTSSPPQDPRHLHEIARLPIDGGFAKVGATFFGLPCFWTPTNNLESAVLLFETFPCPIQVL